MKLFSFKGKRDPEPAPVAPAVPVEAPRKKRSRGHRVDFDHIRADEVRQLLASVEDVRDRTIIATFCLLGCRSNELRMLNVDDIDWDERTVRILHAKGGKQRLMPADLLMPYLAEWLEHRREAPPDEFGRALFPTSTSSRISNRYIRTLVKRYGERAVVGQKIPQKLHPHALRHSFATILHKQGVDLATIQVLMGHSSPATTTLYAFVDPETKRGAVAKLPFTKEER